MAAITKLSVLILIVCFVAVFCQAEKSENEERNKRHYGSVHNLVKRSLYHEDGDGNIGNDFLESSFENAFERPHKIRMLPGYLH